MEINHQDHEALTHGDTMNVKINVLQLKNIKLICVFMAIFLMIVFWFCSQYFYVPRMVASFKETEVPTRKISLLSTVNYGESVICTNFIRSSQISFACVFQNSAMDPSSDRLPVIFAIKPDYSGYYIGSKTAIYEYDSNGQYIRELEVPEFDMNPYQYRSLEKIQASSNILWILLSYETYETGDDAKYVIAEWNLNDPISVPQILTTDIYNNEVNIFGQAALDFENEGGLYILDSKEVIGKSWPEVDIAEVIAGGSLISSDVSHIDIPRNTKSNIAKGSQAMWASDGYIYYLRKGTQLWRVKPGSKPEAVYKATGFARGREPSTGNELVFNRDRTCLAFCYRTPIYRLRPNRWDIHSQLFGAVRCGVVIIDIEANEYIHIPAKKFYDIYKELYSKGSLDLCEPVRMSLNFNKDFWHISDMALIMN